MENFVEFRSSVDKISEVVEMKNMSARMAGYI